MVIVHTHMALESELTRLQLITCLSAVSAVSSRLPRVTANLPAAAIESEYMFEKLAKSAEEVLEASGNWQAASLQLRTAFTTCPTCE